MTVLHERTDTADRELDQILDAAAAAAPAWEDRTPRERARVLVALADALQTQADSLVTVAGAETGLPAARLRGELTRTDVQLKMYAEELLAGRFLDVVIDLRDPDFVLGPRPDLRRYQVPLGPVLVFAASNFPFAFSVAGTDTASALAAGCPVIVKAHPGHPRTSALTAEILTATLDRAGAPAGTFAMITGVDAGVRALQDPRIAAAAFTGSVPGGRALFDVAAARRCPIPFYGELGSLNPAVITPGAAAARSEDIAKGFVDSFTLGAGQFCTKPGLLLVPRDSALVDRIAALVAEVPAARLLTTKIAEGFRSRLKDVIGVEGVDVLVEGGEQLDDGADVPSFRPTLLRTSAEALLDRAEVLLEETFGPTALIVEYGAAEEVHEVLTQLDGALTVTVHTPEKPDAAEREQLRHLVRLAAVRAGRLVFNGWPTGVAVTPAQTHGGPYPATTAVAHTSVGTAAIRRFLRPIAFQDAPAELLPDQLHDTNPMWLPRTTNKAGQSAAWGRAAF
ncbi:MAG: aldehyde dehydrogenase (NADP(+)) [Mycobacterium sp.]